MTTFEDLCAIAYKAERIASRRAARNRGLSEEETLKNLLETRAGTQSLGDLIQSRQQSALLAQAKIDARKQSKAEALAKKRADQQPDDTSWLAWFDGSSHPNPGKMGIGAVLQSPSGDITKICCAAGQGDNNVAEYLALIALLEEAARIQPDKLAIYGDSQIIINEVSNAAIPGALPFQNHRRHAMQLIRQLKEVTLTWIPRKKNTAADALSQQAAQLVAGTQMHQKKITLINPNKGISTSIDHPM